jgi:hypothetical protein
VLFILKPLSFVSAAVNVSVDSSAVSLIILPFSLVDVSISMNQSSSAVGLVALPVSLVAGAIKPDLNATAIAHVLAFNPLSFIFGTIFEQENVLFYSLCAIIVDGVTPLKRWKFSQNVLNLLRNLYTYHHCWIIVYFVVDLKISTDEGITSFFITTI